MFLIFTFLFKFLVNLSWICVALIMCVFTKHASPTGRPVTHGHSIV